MLSFVNVLAELASLKVTWILLKHLCNRSSSSRSCSYIYWLCYSDICLYETRHTHLLLIKSHIFLCWVLFPVYLTPSVPSLNLMLCLSTLSKFQESPLSTLALRVGILREISWIWFNGTSESIYQRGCTRNWRQWQTEAALTHLTWSDSLSSHSLSLSPSPFWSPPRICGLRNVGMYLCL